MSSDTAPVFSALAADQKVKTLGWIHQLCGVVLDPQRTAGERITASGYLAQIEYEIARDEPLSGWVLALNTRPSTDIMPLIREWIRYHP